MGQAKRRKDLGLAPRKTSKPRQMARIKRDNDFMGMGGMGFPMAMGALLGMMSRRRKSQFIEFDEEDYNETLSKHIIPDLEEVEEEDK